jgi:hypothetical protein
VRAHTSSEPARAASAAALAPRAADPRASVRALSRAIGNRAMASLVARQGPLLNPADPRLADVFAKQAGAPGPVSPPQPRQPQWMPQVRQRLPIQLGEGTRRSPKLKWPDGPGEAGCRGACGPDCPETCKNVGTYSEEYVVGDKGYEIEFPNVLECGTHQGCRIHDACFDTAVANGERYLFGPRHNQCNQDAVFRFGAAKTKSWMSGGGPYDGWWHFTDDPVIRRTWAIKQ